MPTVTFEMIKEKALSLLESGEVNRVFGYKKGEFIYDEMPYVFTGSEEIEKDFVFTPFSVANFSKYLIEESKKEGRIAVFMKPCDTFSFVQLLTEHRVNRDGVYIVGIDCENMIDIYALRERTGDDEVILSCDYDGDKVRVNTLYQGEMTFDRTEIAEERCLCCKSKNHKVYDELLCDTGEDFSDKARMSQVEKLEKMSEEERYAFWQGELSKCIRCNACRNVCPACSCEKCVFDNPDSGMQNKAAANSFEEQLFHIIRAYHVAGRCTDCGECSRVCPQRIPLHLLNRKYIKDINELYGRYRAGEKEGQRAPMTDYTEGDKNPSEATEA